MIAPLPARGKNLLAHLGSFCAHEYSHKRLEGADCVDDGARDSARSRRQPSARFTFCRIAIRLAALSTMLLLPRDPSAESGSAGTTLGVGAVVVRNCSVATEVSNPVGPASSATKPIGNAKLTVTCSKGAGQTIAIDTDGNASATKDIRPLSKGVSTLNFDVHKEAFMLIVNF